MTPEEWEAKLHRDIALYNAGDYEAASGLVGAEVRVRRAPDAPEGAEDIRGRERIAEFMKPELFKDQRLEVLGIDHGPDRMLVHARFSALGMGSGIPVEADGWLLYELEGDEVASLEIHQDEDAGRAAFASGATREARSPHR